MISRGACNCHLRKGVCGTARWCSDDLCELFDIFDLIFEILIFATVVATKMTFWSFVFILNKADS